jgi:hypothetical protein
MIQYRKSSAMMVVMMDGGVVVMMAATENNNNYRPATTVFFSSSSERMKNGNCQSNMDKTKRPSGRVESSSFIRNHICHVRFKVSAHNQQHSLVRSAAVVGSTAISVPRGNHTQSSCNHDDTCIGGDLETEPALRFRIGGSYNLIPSQQNSGNFLGNGEDSDAPRPRSQ